MKHSTLPANEIQLNPATGFLLRRVKSEIEPFILHDHEFFEIFLVLKGNAKHYVNGNEFSLRAGMLIFVRDSDIHHYHDYEKSGLDFFNLSFSKETLGVVMEFLGDGFDSRALFAGKYPPVKELSEHDAQSLYLKFAFITSIDSASPEKARMEIRLLLANVFTAYFRDIPAGESKIPLWLEYAHEKMRLPENFIEGRSRFFRLCGKTPEHCSRELQRYYGMSPSEYINSLRFNYAANLLISSNLSASDICYECGFNSPPHFHTGFVKLFGMTPREYRQKNM